MARNQQSSSHSRKPSGSAARIVGKGPSVKRPGVAKAEFRRLQREARERSQWETEAVAARYDAASDRIVVELNNGILFSAPRSHVPELQGASPSEIAAIDVTGDALLWKTGAGVLVWQLLTGAFSGRHWLAELGRCGGMVSTPKKRAAARKNGRKGG